MESIKEESMIVVAELWAQKVHDAYRNGVEPSGPINKVALQQEVPKP